MKQTLMEFKQQVQQKKLPKWPWKETQLESSSHPVTSEKDLSEGSARIGEESNAEEGKADEGCS